MEKFKATYYPDEIADELILLSQNSENKDKKESYVECLYWLKNTAENPYNHNFFAEFYQLLESIAQN